MQYRINDNLLIETNKPIMEDELGKIQDELAHGEISEDDVLATFQAKRVQLNDPPSEYVPAQVLITTEEYDRLRRAAGEL